MPFVRKRFHTFKLFKNMGIFQTTGNFLKNPFERIAGMRALIWGLVGMAVATWQSVILPFHYHGLLHYGPAPVDALWVFVAEHLTVWLLPAFLILAGGKLLSASRVRTIDVLGMTAFAQIPFAVMNLFYFPAPVRLPMTLSQEELMELAMIHPETLMGSIWFVLPSLLFVALVLVWMFRVVRVGCNLKGWKLWTVWVISVVGGDLLSRVVIQLFY